MTTIDAVAAEARELVSLAKDPAWVKKVPFKQRDKRVKQLQADANALRHTGKAQAEALVAIVLGLPISWVRSQLLAVLAGLDGAKPIAQREVAAKLLAEGRPDRSDLYVAVEALYAVSAAGARTRLRAILRDRKTTAKQRLLVDVVCDMLERRERSLASWLPDIFRHVAASDSARGIIERDARSFNRYVAWAAKADRQALVTYLIQHAEDLVYNDVEWFDATRPELRAVLAASRKRGDPRARRLAKALAVLDIIG